MPGLVLFALLSLAVSCRTKSPVYLWPGLRVVAWSPAGYIASCQKNARSANGEAVKSTVLICRLPFDGVSVNGGLCFSFPALWAGLGVGKVTKCYRKRPRFDAPRIRLFATRIYRPKYYKYFDSWELVPLPDLPTEYTKIPKNYNYSGWFFGYLHKSIILLRWQKQLKKAQKVQKIKERICSLF